VSIVLLSLEGLTLLLGARMCWLTRGATDAVNATGLGREGAHLFINKNVMLAIYTMIMICGVEFAAQYMTNLTIVEEVLVVNAGFFLALLSSTFCIFLPKFLELYFPSKEEKKRRDDRESLESDASNAGNHRRVNSVANTEIRHLNSFEHGTDPHPHRFRLRSWNISSVHSRGSTSDVAAYFHKGKQQSL